MPSPPKSSPTRPATSRLVFVSGVVGLVVGLFDALSTLVLGFTPGEGGRNAVIFVSSCAIFVGASSAAIGGVVAGLFRLLAVFGFRGWDDEGGMWWNEMRISSRVWLAAVFGPLWTGLVFVFVFQLGPLFEFSLLGDGGFLQPLTPIRLASIAVVVLAGAIVVGLVYFSSGRRRISRALWGLGLLALAWQVFHQVYIVSYLPPVSWIHGIQAMTLLGLLTVTWLAVRWSPEHRWAKRGGGAVGLAMLALLAPLAVGATIERTLGDQLRLTIHERTAVTFRLLGMLPDAVGPTRRDVQEDCEKPSNLTLSPDNCPAPEDVETLDGVVLVVVDTLREDRLRAERDGQPLMPNLREFAEENYEFERAYAPSASTRRSFGAIKSGRVASVENLSDSEPQVLLAEALSNAGVWTGAVPSHTHLGDVVEGFEHVDTSILDTDESLRFAVTDGEITDRTIEMLEQAPEDRPFFVMAHYFGPHAYYVRHDDYPFGWSGFDRYDAEVAYTDEQLGELLDYLDETRPDDDFAVVVTSDHGEEFFDHRYSQHGVRLYDESVHIPLLADLPVEFDCEACEKSVSLVDLAPTTASMLGVDPQPYTGAGATCLHGKDGEFDDQRPVFLQATNRRGLVFDKFKYIEEDSNRIRQFYDLDEDPGETRNLLGERPERADELACLLEDRRSDVFH